jgi:hypothetical protein
MSHHWIKIVRAAGIKNVKAIARNSLLAAGHLTTVIAPGISPSGTGTVAAKGKPSPRGVPEVEASDSGAFLMFYFQTRRF